MWSLQVQAEIKAISDALLDLRGKTQAQVQTPETAPVADSEHAQKAVSVETAASVEEVPAAAAATVKEESQVSSPAYS